jgi:RNA polymerase sigma factor (sigma-70 family)
MSLIDLHWREFIEKGDEHSFSVIYNNRVDDLFSYGISLGFNKELCRDAIQDTFYKLYITREKLQHVENITAYLFMTFKHRLFDLNKVEKRGESIDSVTDSFPIHVTVLEEIIDLENSEIVKMKVASFLNRLTVSQREIVYLKYMVGLQHREIAEVLGINEESARKLLYRAMEKMRKFASQENIPEKILLYTLVSIM